MADKETLEDYLIRILKNPENSDYIKNNKQSFLEQSKKEYYTFLSTLNLSDERGGITEDLFLIFHEYKISPSKYITKRMGREWAYSQLEDANYLAKYCYNEILYPQYYDQIIDEVDPSEIEIYLNDYKRINGIGRNMESLNKFLNDFSEKLSSFYFNIYNIINKVCDRDDMPISFADAVDIEILKFRRFKYCNYYSYGEGREYIYDGKNENPYKNLYIYSLISYIKYFYVLEIPEITPDIFPDVSIINQFPKKEKYTRRDVARVYAMTYGLNEEKVFENIKKVFQKIKYIQKYKKGRIYVFPDLLLPMFTYHFFKRHNQNEDDNDSSLISKAKLVNNLYYPLFKAKADGRTDIIDAYIKYRQFIIDEFEDMLKYVDDSYIETLINEIFVKSINRLSLRIISLNQIVIDAI